MRTAAFVILMLIPANAGCASLPLPMDGSLLSKVGGKEQGPACECRTSRPQSVCYCGPQECGSP